jgi:hypothetical protein
MTDEPRLVSLHYAATRIFGDSSPDMRRQVMRMITAGDLRGWRPRKSIRSTWWVVASSLNDFLEEMDRREPDPTA